MNHGSLVHVKFCELWKNVNHKSKFTEKLCELGSQKFGSRSLFINIFSIQIRVNQTFVNHLCLKINLIYHPKGSCSALKGLQLPYVNQNYVNLFCIGSHKFGSQVIRIFFMAQIFPYFTNFT